MKRKVLALLVSGVALGLVGKAIADGIPTVTPLTYSGVLQNSNGTAVTTQQSMQLTLWDDATANASVNQKCVTPTQNLTPDAQGRFQVQLDQACFDAVKANPNLWVQVQVGSTVLPRTKIGAVPYAVEAGKASRTVLVSSATVANKTNSVGLFCGATSSLPGQIQYMGESGYRAVKLLCQQACASETARVCTSHEAVVSYSVGLPVNGRLAAGFVPGGSVGGLIYTDCGGFHYSDANLASLYWGPGNGHALSRECSQSLPVACCD